jgi:hypothetical protein
MPASAIATAPRARHRRQARERFFLEINGPSTVWDFTPASELTLTRERGKKFLVCQMDHGRWKSLEPERELSVAQYGDIHADGRLGRPVVYRKSRRSAVRPDNVLRWFLGNRLPADGPLEQAILIDINEMPPILAPVSGRVDVRLAVTPTKLSVLRIHQAGGDVWLVPIAPRDYFGHWPTHVEAGKPISHRAAAVRSEYRSLGDAAKAIGEDAAKVIAATALRQIRPVAGEPKMLWIPEELSPALAHRPGPELGFRWPKASPSRVAEVPAALYYRFT